MTDIKTNPVYLSTEEKDLLSKCITYSYVYDVGLIFLKLADGSHATWDCSNTVAAKEYLDQLGVKEIR